jgi:transcription antitermination factor NusG
VKQILDEKEYEVFLPSYISRRKWSDRVKQVELPLFPGYLFCRLNLANRLPVLTTPGVLHILGFGNGPVAVDEKEISAIRMVAERAPGFEPCAFLTAGQKVEILSGPLQGLEGILVQHKNAARLVISVSLLQRSVLVDIDAAYIKPIPGSGHISTAKVG